MCVVSMVFDHYTDKWTKPIFPAQQFISPYTPQIPPSPDEIKEFRDLLIRAREYDKKHNQPNCELQEKKDRLKALAKDLGFNIEFIEEELNA